MNITKQVLDYQAARRSLDQVIDSVAELVYRYPMERQGFTEEDSAEFLLRFYPRIRGLVKRYRDRGSSFEAYLRTTMRWQLRSLVLERVDERIRLATATDRNTVEEIEGRKPHTSGEMPLARRTGATTPAERSRMVSSGAVRSIRPAGGPPRPAPNPPHRPSALRLSPRGPRDLRLSPGEAQRLLCLSLKSREALGEDSVGRLAHIVGCDPRWLEDRYSELHVRTETLHARRAMLREKRDRAWFRLRCVESRLLEALPSERERLRQERARWHRRFERARLLLVRSPAGPSHAQIAAVLGIAKGTVDSSIFKARQELRRPEYRARLARLYEAT